MRASRRPGLHPIAALARPHVEAHGGDAARGRALPGEPDPVGALALVEVAAVHDLRSRRQAARRVQGVRSGLAVGGVRVRRRSSGQLLTQEVAQAAQAGGV